ncbi:hypothetical protein BDW22DRAFT_515439 [Trametopsis cervina]|nr:hypothetical protein BDW22DRAFT_515439 [Trametopsis cervina]
MEWLLPHDGQIWKCTTLWRSPLPLYLLLMRPTHTLYLLLMRPTHTLRHLQISGHRAIERPHMSVPFVTYSIPHPGDGRGPGGAGRGRGRGRGRGGTNARGGAAQASRGPPAIIANPQNVPHTGARAPEARVRPTHFLSLPIGHHAGLRKRMGAFENALLDHSPKIPGLDEGIVVSPRRMHLTLGVMNLIGSAGPSTYPVGMPVPPPPIPGPNTYAVGMPVIPPPIPVPSTYTAGMPTLPPPVSGPKSVQSAIDFLHALRPRILEKIAGEELRLGLDQMDIMRPERGDLTKAHIMWAGPSYDSHSARHLKRVCEFIQQEFKQAGFVVDEKRPLKLHCTVINTSHRKGRRQPFSYADVIASAPFRAIEDRRAVAPGARQGSVVPVRQVRGSRPIPVDLGEWGIDELQICKMGSWGPQGEYVAVGRIPLR